MTNTPHTDLRGKRVLAHLTDGTTADDVPALVARVRELEEENQKLRNLVGDLTDDGTCWYDHHGYCQEHGWFATDPKCPHARAREITQEKQ